ncbi:MAG: PTS sugar transporter subunit IIC, partial [Cellulosilyticaceae bacterium]
MDKFMSFMDKYIVPYAARLGAQRHLVAIRDAFIAMISITMVGSVAVLINNIPFDPYQQFMVKIFGEGWKTLNNDVWFGTLALMGLFLVAGIAYNLAKSYEEDGLQAALISVACFFILIPQTATITPDVGEAVSGWGLVAVKYLGTESLFTAIIVGIVATEIFVRLSRVKQLIIKLPNGVPPAVSRSFAKLIPGMFTLVIFGIIGILVRLVGNGYLTDLINTYLGIPLSNVADSLPSAIFIAFIVHILWFVGLHGANIVLPFTETLLTKLGAENAALIEQGAALDQLNVLAGPFFDAFVYLGGSGVILGLLIAVAIAGKRRRDMLALGLLPSAFNISEPVIFGFPIVLNPIFGIPFVIAPIINTIIAYLAIASGMVHPVITAKLPWTTPPILGG